MNGSGLMDPHSKAGHMLRWNVVIIFLVVLAILAFEGAILLKELLILVAGVLFITYLLMGPVNAMDRLVKRIKPRMPDTLSGLSWMPSINPRFFSVITVFIGFVLLLVAATVMILPVISSQVGGFARDLPGYYQQVEDQLEDLSRMRLGQLLFQSVLNQEGAQENGKGPQEIVVKVETVEETQQVPGENGVRQPAGETGSLSLSGLLGEEEPVSRETHTETKVRQTQQTQQIRQTRPEIDPLQETPMTEAQEQDLSEEDPTVMDEELEDELEFLSPDEEETGDEAAAEPQRTVHRIAPPADMEEEAQSAETAGDVAEAMKDVVTESETVETVQITTETHVVQIEEASGQKQKTALGQMISYFQRYASATFLNIMEVITTSFTGLLYFLTALVLTFYFLLDGPRLKDGFVGLMPAKSRLLANSLLEKSHFLLVQFLRIQISFSLITGIVLYAIYTLLGLKYAGFLSFFFAVLSLIPVLGPCIGAIPSAMVLIFTDQPYSALAIFTLVAGFYLVKQRWLVGRMFGRHFDINPILMLLVLMICLQVIGIGGLLLAIPLACLITAALHNYRRGPETPEAIREA